MVNDGTGCGLLGICREEETEDQYTLLWYTLFEIILLYVWSFWHWLQFRLMANRVGLVLLFQVCRIILHFSKCLFQDYFLSPVLSKPQLLQLNSSSAEATAKDVSLPFIGLLLVLAAHWVHPHSCSWNESVSWMRSLEFELNWTRVAVLTASGFILWRVQVEELNVESSESQQWHLFDGFQSHDQLATLTASLLSTGDRKCFLSSVKTN